jgi:hypothetical protein
VGLRDSGQVYLVQRNGVSETGLDKSLRCSGHCERCIMDHGGADELSLQVAKSPTSAPTRADVESDERGSKTATRGSGDCARLKTHLRSGGDRSLSACECTPIPVPLSNAVRSRY